MNYVFYIILLFTTIYSQCEGEQIEDDCGECWQPYCYCLNDHSVNFDITKNECEEQFCWWIGPGGYTEPGDELFCYFDPYWNTECTGCLDLQAINYDINATIECDIDCDGETGDCCEYDQMHNNLIIENSIKIKEVFPNPFNPKTNIIIDMPSYNFVELNIYNISGQLIKNIYKDYLNQGTHSFIWNAKDFQSGIYIARMITKNETDSYIMHLLK